MSRQTLPAMIFVLLSTGVQAGNDPYGLLFTTPDQRARLDNRFGVHGSGNDHTSETSMSEQRTVLPLKLNGTLSSSIGKKEIWINGESQLAPGQSKSSQVRLTKAGSVRVKPTVSAQEHEMKPGQILDPNTGSVIEAYLQTLAPDIARQDTEDANTPDNSQ